MSSKKGCRIHKIQGRLCYHHLENAITFSKCQSNVARKDKLIPERILHAGFEHDMEFTGFGTFSAGLVTLILYRLKKERKKMFYIEVPIINALPSKIGSWHYSYY